MEARRKKHWAKLNDSHSRQGSRKRTCRYINTVRFRSSSQSGKGAIVRASGSIERYPLFWDHGYSQERLSGGGDVCKGL